MDSGSVIGWIGIGVTILANFAILVKMNTKVAELAQWQIKVDAHLADAERHLDPRRDGRRWDDYEKRLDRIEKKLDTVIALERDTKRFKGDSEDA